ncbi:MAG: hypothetical protein ACQEWW_07775 [Bacillota bacterium]
MEQKVSDRKLIGQLIEENKQLKKENECLEKEYRILSNQLSKLDRGRTN